LESAKHQQYAIADQQFGTSFFKYPYRYQHYRIDKNIGLTMFQLLIGDCVLLSDIPDSGQFFV